MRIGAGLSSDLDVATGAAVAAREAARALGGADADLAIVFASGAHLAAPDQMLATIQAELEPGALVGCGSGMGRARGAAPARLCPLSRG